MNGCEIHVLFFSIESNIKVNNEYDLTKSETERFLLSLEQPTCKCLDMEQRPVDTVTKQSSMDDSRTNISINNSFSQLLTKKKTKPNTIKGR